MHRSCTGQRVHFLWPNPFSPVDEPFQDMTKADVLAAMVHALTLFGLASKLKRAVIAQEPHKRQPST